MSWYFTIYNACIFVLAMKDVMGNKHFYAVLFLRKDTQTNPKKEYYIRFAPVLKRKKHRNTNI